MLPEPRCYQGEADLARMCDLLQAGRSAGVPAYYVHTGDLRWWLHYPPGGSPWWEHIHLWDNPANPACLLAWALIDPSGETFDLYYRPELHASPTAEALLAWAEQAAMRNALAAGNKEVGAFWIVPQDAFRVRWLEARGYTIRYQSMAFGRSLAEALPQPALPEGYTLRSCRGLDEVESRARAQYGAFESEFLFDQYVDRFRRFMQSPVYDPELDVVAAAPDGTIAAFAIAWTDPVNCVGLFEPVGTHPDHQRRGLGRAVMLEGMRRLQEQGMRRAILCTGEQNTPAVQMYFALGFERYNSFRFYSREFA